MTLGPGVTGSLVSNCSPEAGPATGQLTVKPGQKVKVSSGVKELAVWNADGTLIDGSRAKTETFTVTGSVTVNSSVQMGTINISATLPDGVTGFTVTPAEALSNVTDASGNVIARKITAPLDKFVTVSADNAGAWSIKSSGSTIGSTAGSSATICLGALNGVSCTLECEAKNPWLDYAYTSSSSSAGEGGIATGSAASGSAAGVGFVGGACVKYLWSPYPTAASSLPFGYYVLPGFGFYNSVFNAFEVAPGLYRGGQSMEYEFLPKPTLSIEVAGGGGGSAECAGYCTASPAMKYYRLPGCGFLPSSDPEVVQVTAHEKPGFIFAGWQGGGTVYTDASGSSENWSVEESSAQSLDSLESDGPVTPVTHNPIWVKMCADNDPRLPAAKSLTATFAIPDQSTCDSNSQTGSSIIPRFPTEPTEVRNSQLPIGEVAELEIGLPNLKIRAYLDISSMEWKPCFNLSVDFKIFLPAQDSTLDWNGMKTFIQARVPAEGKKIWCALKAIQENYPCYIDSSYNDGTFVFWPELGLDTEISKEHEKQHYQDVIEALSSFPLNTYIVEPIPYSCLCMDPDAAVLEFWRQLISSGIWANYVDDFLALIDLIRCGSELKAYQKEGAARLKQFLDSGIMDPDENASCPTPSENPYLTISQESISGCIRQDLGCNQ